MFVRVSKKYQEFIENGLNLSPIENAGPRLTLISFYVVPSDHQHACTGNVIKTINNQTTVMNINQPIIISIFRVNNSFK